MAGNFGLAFSLSRIEAQWPSVIEYGRNAGMSLFLKSLGEVGFSDIQAFCGAYQEGIRVEYKESVANIPKVVSSFANTSGGIWVIGAKEHPRTRTGIITGLPVGQGYEEQIIQSCLTGVYPAIRPAVRVFPVDGAPDTVVVVVKVAESIEAPHAIENSTKAYIRTASVSQPYDLADMDRLDYFFRRRQDSESKRELLVRKAISHCRSRIPPKGFRVVICPTYPYQPVRSLDEIESFVAGRKYDGRQLNLLFREIRRVQNGMLDTQAHLELNIHGIVLYQTNLEVQQREGRSGTMQSYIWVGEPILLIGEAMNIAREFIGDALVNLFVRVQLFHFDSVWLQYDRNLDEGRIPGNDFTCYEPEVIAETRTTIEGLGEGMVQTITEIMRQILWVFNRSELSLENKVEETLQSNHLLPSKG